jgi:peptide/nickel transport system ATP-binding protein
MSDPVLSVENLSVSFDSYDGRAEVIDGVDLELRLGETAALVGETGCGKSVTVKAILGLLNDRAATVTADELRFEGKDLLSLSEQDRRSLRGREMGLIMQDPMTSLNPVFTIGEQMMDVLRWRGERRVGPLRWLQSKFRDQAEQRERILEMLERVQISAPERVYESYPVELSGGMRQRVLIATALLSEPDLLIADEPTTALDVTTESRILDLFEKLIDETDACVLYITHNLGVARSISDSINVMYAGEIVERAPTTTLFDRPQHPYTRGLLDSIPRLSTDMGDGIPGQIPDYTDPPAGCRFAARCPHAEDACVEHTPHLRNTESQHAVACHLYDGDAAAARHTIEAVDIGRPPWEDAKRGDAK